jgi:hypothetical protein
MSTVRGRQRVAYIQGCKILEQVVVYFHIEQRERHQPTQAVLRIERVLSCHRHRMLVQT